MADLICRWRNGTPQNVVEVVNSMPHHEMPEWQFKDYMLKSVWGKGFARTVYQFASQLALYYISDDGIYHPRFDHDINALEAKDYMERWLPRYYIPNPYVSSDGFNKIDCPTFFLKKLYDYTVKHPNCSYAEAYKECFHETAKNNDDIIRNYINSYSKVLLFQKDGTLSITNVNPDKVFNNMDRNDRKAFFDSFNPNSIVTKVNLKDSTYRPYITAIKSKPFLLLAGISGTGKSRIVRELARACWDEGSAEFKAQKPKNFEMVQVKPNWHDSSELIGYVSRIDGVRYVVGPFLKFMVKAINDPDTPYFLCLDEMNLAPVEQYFAEYLSVVESRKRQEDGTITTDPIVDYSNTDEYKSLIDQLFPDDDTQRSQYLTEKGGKRLSIPTNLIVVGTVNMDETTFSFSRKVLDRAMTIEMNEVNLKGGLDRRHEKIGKLEKDDLVGEAVEGVDVYDKYEDVCNTAITYLEKINDKLEGTPFKIAYRTRNEVLLYVINNLPYNKIEGDDESTYKIEFVVARALDEITNMKILSRIEGDETKVTTTFLKELGDTIHDGLEAVFAELFDEDDDDVYTSVSLAKLEEMKERLKSGYTSFWS
jgi:hypothetical protein